MYHIFPEIQVSNHYICNKHLWESFLFEIALKRANIWYPHPPSPKAMEDKKRLDSSAKSRV